MQEYFVDDLCELLLYVGHTSPKSLEGLHLEEIMTFMVVFMGSPGYVKNPFVRSRISEVLCKLGLPNQPLHTVELLHKSAAHSDWTCSALAEMRNAPHVPEARGNESSSIIVMIMISCLQEELRSVFKGQTMVYSLQISLTNFISNKLF